MVLEYGWTNIYDGLTLRLLSLVMGKSESILLEPYFKCQILRVLQPVMQHLLCDDTGQGQECMIIEPDALL